MSRLTDSLYVGGCDEAFDAAVLSKVTHVLNVAIEINVRSRRDHVYRKIAVADDDDDADIGGIFDECVQWVHEAISDRGGVVLVHCMEGVSRSVCVCIAYLCVRGGLSLAEATAMVEERRPQTDVFPRYRAALCDYVARRTGATA